jgi:ketosteroid isomerase-like protein
VSEADVLAANEAFYQAFNQKDIPAMEAVWAESAPVTCIHPGWTALSGRGPVLDSWRSILNNPNQPRIMSGRSAVIYLGEIAIVLCRELVAGTPLEVTNVFIEENGAWRMLHHHSSPASFTPGSD